MANSKYPVGATWEAKNTNGLIGRITLAERYLDKYEVWDWHVVYDDGSGYRHDRCSSYKKCRDEMPLFNPDYSIPKFRRIK